MTQKHVLLDTNILVYLTSSQSLFQGAAKEAVKKELQEGAKLYVTMQILREYAKVMTTVKDSQTGNVVNNLQVTLAAIQQFRHNIQVIGDSPQSFEKWLELLEKYDVHGREVFDTQIAAQMLQSNVTHILTNDERFSRYSDIVTIIPLQSR
jgi:predicted nucleic acid-binding protein